MKVNEYIELITRFANDTDVADITKKNIKQTLSFFTDAVEQYGIDPTLMTEAQLAEYYQNNLNRSRTSSIVKFEQRIQLYVAWRQEHGLPTSDDILKVHPDAIDGLRKTMVASPLHLQMILDAVFPSEKLDVVDIIYRAFIWLTFTGLSMEQAFDVTKDDVDFIHMTVRSNGVEYVFCQQAMVSLWKACTLTQFEEFRTMSDTNIIRRRVFKRVEGNLILRIKSRLGIERQYSSMRTIVAKKFSMAEEEFENKKNSSLYFRATTASIRTSGVFYRQYERERIGLPVDFTEEAERATSHMDYDGTLLRGKLRARQRVRKDFEDDYPRWKQVYALGSDD